jgi:hypothetical protein
LTYEFIFCQLLRRCISSILEGLYQCTTPSHFIKYIKKLKDHHACSLEGAPKSRPIGVTIIAILNIIGGAFMLVFGIGLITLGAILPTLPPSVFNQTDIQGNLTAEQLPIPPPAPSSSGSPMALQSFLGGLGIAFGAVLVAIAIVSFVVAYGLLKGKGWAWTLAIILSIISIVWNAITLATAANFGGIISIIISGIILYYLFRPHVKEYFGKG